MNRLFISFFIKPKHQESFMKKISAVFFTLSMLISVNAYAAFDGSYAVSNWAQSVNGGSIDSSGAPNSVTLVSSNAGNGNTNQDFTFTAVQDGYVNFAWSYSTADKDGATWDTFGWLLNGSYTQVTNDAGPILQSGSLFFHVFAGDVFGFRTNSLDSAFGAATTTVSDFKVASTVPVPAAMWLMIAPLMGLVGKKRQLNA
jgi:hypothetical protein